MSRGCKAASSPSRRLVSSPAPLRYGPGPAAAARTCMVTVLVSTGTQRRPSSPQQPPQRCRETQEGLKMYSTSLGNSVMTSTSCSRGRQKLRFQISRKVRTARDRDCKEAPGEAEPGRAAAGAGAAAARASCSHHGAQRSKGPLCAPSKSVTVLCTSLCGGSHSRPDRLFVPLSARSVSCPGTLLIPELRREGAPPHLARPDSRPLGLARRESRSGALPPGTPHASTGGAAVQGPGCAPARGGARCPRGAGGIKLLRASAQVPATSPVVTAGLQR